MSMDTNADLDEGISVLPTNVGHLLQEPVEIDCPACHQNSLTTVEYEAVTCLQKIVAVINFCLCCTPIKWSGRHDINHYCSKCGCYIGRYITLSWYKRQLFRMQRSEIDEQNRWQRFRNIEKQQLDKKKQKIVHDNENE